MATPLPDPQVPVVASVDQQAASRSRLWSTHLHLMVAAVLAFAGLLRLQMQERLGRQESHWVRASLSTRLSRGVARAELPLPPALAAQTAFEIEAPEAAQLFEGETEAQPLVPARCQDSLCTYHVQLGQVGIQRLTAQVKEPGRYGFKLVQHTSFGDVQERVALSVAR